MIRRLLHLELNKYDTVVDALNNLKAQGYHHSFKVRDNEAVCLETKEKIKAQDMEIVEFHRFEGDTDPGDMAIIYVVECENGINGCIVDAYGMYSDGALNAFLNQVSIAEKKKS